MTIIKVILYGLIIALVATLGAVGLSHAMSKSEVAHCEYLKAQSDQFPLFFISPADKALCDHLNIEIDAPSENPALAN